MGKGLYYLVYKDSSSKAILSIKEISINSRDLLRIGGLRAKATYKVIMDVLNTYALKYDVHRDVEKSREYIELPGDLGYAILIYMLLTYSCRDPLKYTSFLEQLLTGKIPLTVYLVHFVNLAIDLSELYRLERGRTIIHPKSAKTVSKMLQILYQHIIQ